MSGMKQGKHIDSYFPDGAHDSLPFHPMGPLELSEISSVTIMGCLSVEPWVIFEM